MEKEIYLYPYSAAEAHTRNELALWRASYQANEECARDIEEHIRTHFDGAHLDDSMLQPLLDKWGYISDVVELYNASGSTFFYIDRYGFQPIEFVDHPSQDQSMSMTL